MNDSAVSAAIFGAGVAVLIAVHWQRQKKRGQKRLQALEALVENQQSQLRLKERELTALRARGVAGALVPQPLHRIVLTGGPCGGKTTALAKLRIRLEELGFLVLTVPETATMLFSGGVPLPSDEASGFAFQKHLMQVQREVEDAFIALAKGSGRPAVVLLDRGLMDGKAYMEEEQWELLLEELQLTPVMLRDQRYDAVVHLVTAADGAAPFYSLANNESRTESVEAAIEVDRRTLDCWTGHEHLYIVDNSCSFEEKIRRAVARISALLGVPGPQAVTRKFLLQRLPREEELRRHVSRYEVFEVESTYLCSPNEHERCRVRRRQQGSNVSFQHQTWVGVEGSDQKAAASPTLIERTLTGREYLVLLKQAEQSVSVSHVPSTDDGARTLAGHMGAREAVCAISERVGCRSYRQKGNPLQAAPLPSREGNPLARRLSLPPRHSTLPGYSRSGQADPACASIKNT